MSEKPNEVVEAYKQRISDLIDEAEKAIGVEDEYDDAVVNP
jgi:hypothetical protein